MIFSTYCFCKNNFVGIDASGGMKRAQFRHGTGAVSPASENKIRRPVDQVDGRVNLRPSQKLYVLFRISYDVGMEIMFEIGMFMVAGADLRLAMIFSIKTT